MRALQWLYAAWVMAVAIMRALLRTLIGLLMIATSLWIIYSGFHETPWIAVLGVFTVWGGAIILNALGPLIGPPQTSGDGGTRLERRKILRRTGMIGRR